MHRSGNIGVDPVNVDLGEVQADVLRELLRLRTDPVVLSACAPCTGFSRTQAQNHLVDDARNSLVPRIGEFARVLRPQVVVLENARELLMGRFSRHFAALRADLESQRYRVRGEVHLLTAFGLPQRRERALVIAVHEDLPLLGLADLWDGFRVQRTATHVRHAIEGLPPVEAGEAHPADPMHVSPRILSETNGRRLLAIPRDGGSWFDLLDHAHADELLTPSMKLRAARRDFGSHPDPMSTAVWRGVRQRPSNVLGTLARPDLIRFIASMFPEASRQRSFALAGSVVPLISPAVTIATDLPLSSSRAMVTSAPIEAPDTPCGPNRTRYPVTV